MIKVVIVDDHAVIRDGLAMLINDEHDLEVCGEASGIVDALGVIEETNPQLAIIDVSLDSGSGIELVKEVKARFPQTAMLVWSMYDESLYAERAIKAGALGYINKKHVRDKVIIAVRSVLAGDVYLSEEYSAKVLNRLTRGGSVIVENPADALSDRELEAFALIGQGLRTKEIAARMELTSTTIETYRSRIKEKLGLDHAAELIREATVWVMKNG